MERITEEHRTYLQGYYLGMKTWEAEEPRPKIDPEDRLVTEAMQDGWDDLAEHYRCSTRLHYGGERANSSPE
jgi:hypothetical protein